MSAYTCPVCGYRTAFGNPASIALHERVSHSGAAPIVEERASLSGLADAAERTRAALEAAVGAGSVSVRPDLGFVIVYASTAAYMLESRATGTGQHRHRINRDTYASAADIPDTYRKGRAIAERVETSGPLILAAIDAERARLLAVLAERAS